LKKFLSASRNAYNSFVLYHNFKHAIDVLQSTFYFLLQLGTLPPYPAGSTPHMPKASETPLANLLEPIDGLTLLISAIGHDVGHPGVNNMFLVKLNAPLAQLYNDTSVLEAFHCAAFSQILRRFWPAAFEDKTIRKMMISNILATDMGIHFKYMTDCGHLQEKVHENKGTDGWSPQLCETYRALLCGLLIKCADISNVVSSVIVDWKRMPLTLLDSTLASGGTMDKHTPARIREPRQDGGGGWNGDSFIWRPARTRQHAEARQWPDRLHEHLRLSTIRLGHGSIATHGLHCARNQRQSKYLEHEGRSTEEEAGSHPD
jgi:hypothetical protein